MGTQQGGGSTGSQTIQGIQNGAGRGASTGEVGLALGTITPNPIRTGSEIEYSLEEGGTFELALYGADGRLIRVLESGESRPGIHRVRIAGTELPSGTYLLRLRQGDDIVTRPVRVVN